MSIRYFADTDRFPPIAKAAVTRLLIYISQTLYPAEYEKDPDIAFKRIILSDRTSGSSEFDISQAIQSFQQFSDNMPFTAYGIDENPVGDLKNWTSHSGLSYFDDIGRQAGAIHSIISLPCTTFFNKADDYWEALSRLRHATSTLVRLDTPISINKVAQELHPADDYQVDITFPIEITAEISKGEYAFAFKKYLTTNKIWDLVINFKISYFDFAFGKYIKDTTVTEMVLTLWQQKGDNTPVNPYIILAPDPLEIISTVPVNESINIPVDVSPIQIIFNNGMKEDFTSNMITFFPHIEYDSIWSSDSKTISFILRSNLEYDTVYTISIPLEIQDRFTHNMESDINITFTTESSIY